MHQRQRLPRRTRSTGKGSVGSRERLVYPALSYPGAGAGAGSRPFCEAAQARERVALG
ncbi:uncharacterized protein BDV14DRAFT_174666 [Aspergillus stella-maris]|uniref:uncharacterized protein n=1 Tax=Aspergillus stella-maris TaxID=1810926 RepID=UPI003CCD0D05